MATRMLLPCAHCNTNNTVMKEGSMTAPDQSYPFPVYCYFCKTCAASGPWCTSEEQALDGWNKRPEWELMYKELSDIVLYGKHIVAVYYVEDHKNER